MSILDGDCYAVDTDQELGSLPSTDQSQYQSYQSFCEGYGDYRILKEGSENSFVMALDFNNNEIPLSLEEKLFYSENVTWVFSSDDITKLKPIALIYSSYEDVLIDKTNNIWEPKETYTVVSLNALKSCVVAEVSESKNRTSADLWTEALSLAESLADQPLSIDCR